MNETDPSGLFGNPVDSFCSGGGPGDKAQQARECLGALIGQEESATIECDEGTTQACLNLRIPGPTPCIGSPSSGLGIPGLHLGAPGLEFDIPPIVIEGDGLALTISSDVIFAGRLSTDAVSVSPDGSVNAQAGGDSATFSSSGAIDAVEAGLGHTGVSVSTDGISYTGTQTKSLGPDTVTSNTKATIGPSKDVPPDDFSVTSGEETGAALVVTGAAIGGGILWWIAKAASPLCAPAGGPIGVAVCAGVL